MITSKTLNSIDEWLAARKHGIGGSDVAALYNESPYQTRAQLIEYKSTTATYNSSPITDFGTLMEPIIFEKYVKPKWRSAVAFDNTIFENTNYPKLIASPDGLIVDQNAILEIKFVNILGSTKWKNKAGGFSLPKHYWHQVQHYMAVLEKKQAFVVAFFQELCDIEVFVVQADEDYAYQLNIDSIDLMEEVGTAKDIPLENPVSVVEPKLGQYVDISNQIKKLKVELEGVKSDIIHTYPAETTLTYNKITGKVLQKTLKAGLVKQLKVN